MDARGLQLCMDVWDEQTGTSTAPSLENLGTSLVLIVVAQQLWGAWGMRGVQVTIGGVVALQPHARARLGYRNMETVAIFSVSYRPSRARPKSHKRATRTMRTWSLPCTSAPTVQGVSGLP